MYLVGVVVGVAAVAVLGGGEASGPIFPPEQLSEDCFSAGVAAAAAYKAAGLSPSDIDYWGLYDCFPICLIRWALQASIVWWSIHDDSIMN
jgi:hypothetical protein